MPPRVALTHITRYRYSADVALGPHLIRLKPAPHCRTPISAYSLRTSPAPQSLSWQQDPSGNFVARVNFPLSTRELNITIDLIADLAPQNPFDFLVDPEASTFPFTYDASIEPALSPFRLTPAPSRSLDAYVDRIRAGSQGRGTIDLLCEIARDLSGVISYRRRFEHGVQTPEESLATASGSCRDSAWLLVDILRRLGLAARFVSGYLLELGKVGEQDDRTQSTDSAALHAWAECYIPGVGWIGFDATSGLLAAEGHIPLCSTPSPESAAPISGTHSIANVEMVNEMRLELLSDTQSPESPYRQAEWQKILLAGAAVDGRLEAGDVRLSMGGEPTFVAREDPLAPEWNLAALGPTKRAYSDKLSRRLMQRFAPGGLVHHGHGKWYPGETAARWAFAVLWRNDGKPLWNDVTLIADETPSAPVSLGDAERYAHALCEALGLLPESAMPAYEDVAHYLLVERRLPLGFELSQAKLSSAGERTRLARILDHGLGQPVGFVLPLIIVDHGGKRRVVTERWRLKREALFLVPGDSPIGLRLPLAGLQDVDFIDYPNVEPRDPMADTRPLPDASDDMGSLPQSASVGPVRTALTVEPRPGHVAIFLPPLSDGEDYATLLAAIESAARRAAIKIRLEGYLPPFDTRLGAIKVTPDPGVIEVNVHPARSWDELVAITEGVNEDASAIGLAADKWLIDGRRIATGGGNHIVVGGLTPADSPFLRRPDLLASLISYWQAHPALSYLFAGQFVGPTSQAPRIDEGRHEQLAELEIAFAQLPKSGSTVAPWIVDRLFRNLLIDVSGNTHRAEICIDKLYSPSGPMGRLGLVEFRAFEMPPDPRMSLACQLLVRALIAFLWERPYRRRMVRFGTTLHDRFLLPTFLWEDLEAIVADLEGAGFPIDAQWFRPHLEFRYPVIGSFRGGDVEVTLRQALEPWHVLAEEGGGTSRRVDSSLDRIEVSAKCHAFDRYAVACNGCYLPLAATTAPGVRVAGVRYRAWPTSDGFHPLIPTHVPLNFDIFDTFNGRSIGGARYHAVDPSGRIAERPPVDAREATIRRAARLQLHGHSPSGTRFASAPPDPEHPLTLDLRRVRMED